MKTKEQFKTRMSEILNIPEDSLNDDADLTSLVNNSFILVELMIELQEECGVCFGQADMRDVKTVGQLIDLFFQQMGE